MILFFLKNFIPYRKKFKRFHQKTHFNLSLGVIWKNDSVISPERAIYTSPGQRSGIWIFSITNQPWKGVTYIYFWLGNWKEIICPYHAELLFVFKAWAGIYSDELCACYGNEKTDKRASRMGILFFGSSLITRIFSCRSKGVGIK